jgi:hypothetical protein
MTTIETIAAIKTLLAELNSRIKGREDAALYQQINIRFEELQDGQRKEIKEVEARYAAAETKHAKEKSEIEAAHAAAVAKLNAENSALKAKVTELEKPKQPYVQGYAYTPRGY